jgi:hypothetical protein
LRYVEHTSCRRHGVSLALGQAGRNALDEELIVDEEFIVNEEFVNEEFVNEEQQSHDDGLA